MARILIVEDYPNLQKLYRTVLEAEGYEVWLAKDGGEALGLVKDHEPDVILLDLLLPREGGLEFLRSFDHEKYAHIKVLVFTNMASPELFAEAKALGADQYLLKAKYTPKEMAEVVKQVLGDSGHKQ